MNSCPNTGKMFYQINRNFIVLEQTIISIKGEITMQNIRNGLVFRYAIRITGISD